jgi:PAS domain S-box-containing protein
MKLSLGAVLAICLAGLQFLAVLIVVLLSYVTSERVLLTHARTLLSDLGSNAILHSKGFLEPARGTAELAKRLAENDIVASDDPQELEKLLFQQLQLAPQFSGVYLGDEQGDFVFVSRADGPAEYRSKIVSHVGGTRSTRYIWRDSDFSIVETNIDPDDKYDPRTRPWYISAKAKRDIIWTDPYIFFTSKRPGITAASPVIGGGNRVRGVVGVDIEIDAISGFLAQLKIGNDGAAMILNNNGDVIAHPDPDLIKVENADGTLGFVSIDDIPDPIAQTAFGNLTKQSVGDIEREIQSKFTYEGARYVSTLIPATSDELPWTIAIYAPEDDFIGGIKENRMRNIWIAAGVALSSGLIGLWLAQFINAPVRDFARSAERATRGDGAQSTYPELQGARDTLISEIEQRKTFEHEFGITFDLASRGMAQIDPISGRFVRVNSHLSDLLGYEDSALLDMGLVDILHPDESDAGPSIRDAVNSGVEYNQESRFLRKDGETVWLRVNAIMIRDKDGNALHAVATVDDVTVQKLSETKIEDLNRDLSHYARVSMMGQMASGLAHELNQPLTAITQNADAALLTLHAQENSDPELVEILNELDSQAHRGADIIRALRGFVSKDSGAKQTFDFGELVDQTFRLVHPESTQHDIEMTFNADTLHDVYGNRIQIAQVLVNLLRNAIQAIADDDGKVREIDVRATLTTGMLQVCVDDTGGGVSPDIDLFAQFETSKPDGMGLGLTFSRTIIEANGGQLWFDETEEGKSRFCFTVPTDKGDVDV